LRNTVGGDRLIGEEAVLAEHVEEAKRGEARAGLPEEFAASAAAEV